MKQLQSIARRCAARLEPPPILTVTEWADEYRFLSQESSAQRGKYRSSVTPYAKEPMNDAGDMAVQSVCLMFASQTGKTEILNNVAGYFIQADPAPIMVVQPTVELGESWSKERLVPMVRDTPVLTGLVKDPKSRDSGNTIRMKSFPGGNIAIVGANAPSGLAGRPRRVVLLDEVDRFPPSAGSEGDPCALAIRRTESYWNSVIYMTSTPTIKGASRIESEYEQTDKRRWFCPCPDCGHEQELKWAQVKWDKDAPETARYECEKCNSRWDDVKRLRAIQSGRWKATAPFHGKRGYYLNGIASPFRAKKGFKSRLHQMAAGFLEAKRGGQESLKTWTNTFLAETFEESFEGVDHSKVITRCEKYSAQAPAGVVVLTAGIDVQGDRVEMEVVGHGIGEETWGIANVVLYGNFDLPDLQKQLDDALDRDYQHENGDMVRVVAAAIDTRHKTKSVRQYCKSRAARRVYAVMGTPIQGAAIVSPRFNKFFRMWTYSIGTDGLKDSLYSRLQIEDVGPRYCHFPLAPDYNEEFFKQLTAEVVKHKYERGQLRRVYVKTRERNEALDKRVYALAAFEILRPNMDALMARQKAAAKPVEYELKPESAPEQIQQQSTKKRPAANRWIGPRRGGWI